jgi:hypothetical protein
MIKQVLDVIFKNPVRQGLQLVFDLNFATHPKIIRDLSSEGRGRQRLWNIYGKRTTRVEIRDLKSQQKTREIVYQKKMTRFALGMTNDAMWNKCCMAAPQVEELQWENVKMLVS